MPSENVPNHPQEITLRRWRVMEVEVPDGSRSRHVWGHDVKSGQGRASSPIVEFALDAMTAITRSGSNYRLVGLPGNSRLGKSAWRTWCRENGVVWEADVTNEYLNVDQLSTVELVKINCSPGQ